MAAIEEHELRLDGVRVFYRRVEGEGTPTVYCHVNPSHGEDMELNCTISVCINLAMTREPSIG